jgi:DNA-binding transcriptional LysR family regulator
MALAQIGYGIAVVPSTVLVPERLRAVPLVQRKTSIGRWMTIAWNSRRSLSAYAKQFVDELVA